MATIALSATVAGVMATVRERPDFCHSHHDLRRLADADRGIENPGSRIESRGDKMRRYMAPRSARLMTSPPATIR